MASTPRKRILMPHSRKTVSQRKPALADTHAFTSEVNFDDTSSSPSPATPELEWSETPPATEDPPTPEDDFDPDDVLGLLHSPLAGRKTTLEQDNAFLHDLSQVDSDVPEQLLSILSSETGGTKRLFQNELCKETLTTSQPHPASSIDYPSTISLVTAGAEEESIPSIVVDIKQEDRSVVSDDIVTTEIHTATVTTISAAEPSQRFAKKPLSLSLVWSLNTKLSAILPLEAVERFDSDSMRCIATTKEGFRCKRSVAPTADESFISELPKALSSLQRSFDFEAFAKHMGQLIGGITCTRSHREPFRKCLEELCSYAWRPREIATTKPHLTKAIAESVESMLRLWISALTITPTTGEGKVISIEGEADDVCGTLCSASVSFAAETEPILTPLLRVSPRVTATPIKANPHATDKNTIIPSITIKTAQQGTASERARLSTHLNHALEKFPYSKDKQNATPQDLIRQTLLKALTSADMWRSGFIYVFWHPGSLGYVKIGYATDVERRLKDWRRQCKFDLEQHKTQETRAMTRVLHLHRVESLIHAELKDYRRFEPKCSGCGKSHREWFEVDPSYALKVVAKWTSRSFYSGGLLDPSISDEEIDKLCGLTEADIYLPRPPPRKVTENSRRSIRGRHRRSK